MIDALSARVAGQDRQLPDEPNPGGNEEMLNAMVAISSAAHAIDGFYGSIVDHLRPVKSKAKRNRQILETLKLGFAVGPLATGWLTELDWLFGVRDEIVHHGERLRPSVVSRVTSETVVAAGPEAFNLSAQSADRAARLAATVIAECLAKPKSVIKPWAERARALADQAFDGAAKEDHAATADEPTTS